MSSDGDPGRVGTEQGPSHGAVIDRFLSASHSFAIALVVLGVVLLFGHVASVTLTPVPPPLLLSVDSAWLLLLAGLSLWLRDASTGLWWRRFSPLFAGSVIAVALLACIGAVQPSWRQVEGAGQFWRLVGTLSPQAAVAFLLGGCGLLTLGIATRAGVFVSQALGLSVIVIAFVALLGYLYDVPLLYAIWTHPPIQIYELAALLLLGLAILFARPDRGIMQPVTSRTPGGVLARSVPAAVVAVPVLLGWVALKGQRDAWWDPAVGVSIFVTANIAFFSLLVFRVARSLDITDRERTLSEEKFARMFRFSPDAMTVTRLKDGQILDVNDGFTQITGFLPAEVIGRSTGDLDLGPVLPVSSPSGENGVAPVRNAQVRVRTKTGEERLGLCSTEVVIVGGEQCLLSVTRDVSDRQRAEEALQEANRQLAQWVADLETRSREISLLNDLSGVLQSCVTPDEACAVAVQFGQQLLPRSEGAICRFAEVGGVLEVVAAWGDLPTGTMFTPLECWALRRGRPYAVSDASTGLACAHVQDRTGSGYVCVPLVAQGETLGVLHVRDLDHAESAEASESRHPDATLRLAEALAAHVGLALANLRLREKLRRQSVRDELTGLYNRRYMEESLERELFRARRASGSLSVALLDLDGFKGVNDGYGHDAGDDLLKVVGQILRTFVRAGDIVCRYGGDEFLFVLPAMELSAAYDRVGEIRAAINKAVVWHQGQAILPVSASAGVVAFPNHGQTAAHLLSAADAALYRAKTRGGNSSEAGPSLGASPQHAA